MSGDRPIPGGADRTVIIPTPGAARGAQTPPPAAGNFGLQSNERIEIKTGLNPLVNSATTLLTLVIKLRSTMQHANVPDLHKRLTEEIKAFESKTRNAGIAGDSVIAARYLLCSVIDEVVLNTPWGASSGWSQHSLLSLFHQETSGGEKCFLILQRMLETPGIHLDVLELFYICLSLGFQGKYRVVSGGGQQIEQIRDNLYKTIESHRPVPAHDLSPNWEGTVKAKDRMANFIPLWVFASVVLAALLLTFSGFRYWLYQTSDPVASKIAAEMTTSEILEKNTVSPEPNTERRFY
jgi:type VI secretion system protein ImpK